MVLEQEIDGLTSGMIATPERKKVMDFAYFFWADTHAMVIPRPGEGPRLFAFIQPFQPNVIIDILVNYMLLAIRGRTIRNYFILSVFVSQVWKIITITIISMVAFMIFFTKVFYHLPTTNQYNSIARHTKIIQYVSAYSIYVINVLTNQGKISIIFSLNQQLCDKYVYTITRPTHITPGHLFKVLFCLFLVFSS